MSTNVIQSPVEEPMPAFCLSGDGRDNDSRELRAFFDSLKERVSGMLAAGTGLGSVAREIADRKKDAVVELFRAARRRAGVDEDAVALVCLGGLARRELAPFSDLDLIIVSRQKRHSPIKALAEEFYYPLWDAGADVGHALRTPSEFERMAREDNTVRTGALDWRLLCGSGALVDKLDKRLGAIRRGRKTRQAMLSTLAEWIAVDECSSVHRLEPNVKTDAGGLRTLHHTWWSAIVAWQVSSWSELCERGHIGEHDFATLERGRAFLNGTRIALHIAAGRCQDQLSYERQDDVARRLGFEEPSRGQAPADALMEEYYRHAKAVKSVCGRVQEMCHRALQPRRRRRPEALADGFRCVGKSLIAPGVEHFKTHPQDLLRVFRVAQRHRVTMSAEIRSEIAAAVPRYFSPEVAGSPTALALFQQVLTDSEDRGRSLESLHELGLLERLVPEFGGVTGLVQRDMFHQYTVDAHLLYCARLVLDCVWAMGSVEIPEEIREAAGHLSRPHVLVMAALLHDLGKGGGYGHSARGAKMVEKIARRFAWKREDTVDLRFLVAEHLKMMATAQRRDLDDADMIDRFAQLVETPERLDMLYVLSFADAVSTGPDVFTEWKATLLRDLYLRCQHALRAGAGRAATEKRVRERVKDILQRAGNRAAEFEKFAELVPRRHLLCHRVSLLLRQMEVVAWGRERGACASIEPDPHRGGWEIVISGADRPRLLALQAAVLAAHGVSIAATYAQNTSDGRSIGTFVVGTGNWPMLEDERQRLALCVELERTTIDGEDSALRARIESRRSSHGALGGSRVPKRPTRVVFDDNASDDATVIDVFALDRVGLLSDIAEAIFEFGASIKVARVSTEGAGAVDAFYLVDAQNGAALPRECRDELVEAIVCACG